MFRKSLYSFVLFVLVFAGQGSVIAAGEPLDPMFGQGGKVLTDFSGLNDEGNTAALQLDGKLVVAGGSFTGMEDDFALARYLPNGDLDPDFGIAGKVTTDLSNDYLLNINTASVTELEALPGVGPVVASRIVEYRTENGPFATIHDLLRVSGVGPMLTLPWRAMMWRQ